MDGNTSELDELFGESAETWGMENRLTNAMAENKQKFATQLALNGLNEATVLLSNVVGMLSPEQVDEIGDIQHWLKWYGVGLSQSNNT